MVSAKGIPANLLISGLKDKLKQNEKIKPPDWAKFVKTGPHAERKPSEPDWWYTRCASILRRTSVEGKVGVGKLKTWYGGRKNLGVKPEHHVDAGGSIIRKALQQLESAGYIKKDKAGRVLTPAGQSLIHKTVLEVKRGMKSGAGGHKKSAPARAPEPAGTEAAAGGAEKTAGVTKETADTKIPRAGSKGKAGKPKAGKPKSS